jgi:hypothetical protein
MRLLDQILALANDRYMSQPAWLSCRSSMPMVYVPTRLKDRSRCSPSKVLQTLAPANVCLSHNMQTLAVANGQSVRALTGGVSADALPIRVHEDFGNSQSKRVLSSSKVLQGCVTQPSLTRNFHVQRYKASCLLVASLFFSYHSFCLKRMCAPISNFGILFISSSAQGCHTQSPSL